jgi:L-asparaginase
MTTDKQTLENDTVAITTLEKDERVALLQKGLAQHLTQERGYADLAREKKAKVDALLTSIGSMRFETRADLEAVATALLQSAAPELTPYIGLALNKASESIGDSKGVLVIYTGGTIGSAPKDRNDPESPQVVRPWKELKQATPQMDSLGYPVDAISFCEPLDSCNVGPRHWRTMARLIEKYYHDYAGFVILHGTDSMVYSASALSFMLVNLAKPVVLTGSQVAGIVNPRNDAHQNIITALILANPEANRLPVVPEVIIGFGNVIVRGNRAKKMNVLGYQGFLSPNYPPLGEAGEFITIERKHIRDVPATELEVLNALDTNVIILEVFPGMQRSQILANILKDDNLRGVVLKSYGAGNIPTDPEFLDLFKSFVDKHGIVVNVTSVPEGEVVMGLYETSQVLLDRGIIGGFDLTPEAALCKLMMLLGNYSDDVPKVRRLMQQSLAGEQHLSLETTIFEGSGQTRPKESRAEIRKAELASVSDPTRIVKVMLRFKNARLDPGPLVYAKIRLSLDSGEPLGAHRRAKVPEGALVKNDIVGESLTIDLTHHKGLFVAKESTGRIRTAHRIGFTVELEGDDSSSLAWDSAELNIYTTE